VKSSLSVFLLVNDQGGVSGDLDKTGYSKNLGPLVPKQRKCNRYREQSKGSGAILANDDVNTHPEGDRMARLRDPTKNVMNTRRGLSLFFLFRLVVVFFLALLATALQA